MMELEANATAVSMTRPARRRSRIDTSGWHAGRHWPGQYTARGPPHHRHGLWSGHLADDDCCGDLFDVARARRGDRAPDRLPFGRSGGRESRPRARTIPAGVRRSVWARDGGQCTYVGTSGRCTEQGFLGFHHVVPFAAGGETSVENMTLLCRAHNQHEAVQYRSTSSGASSSSVSAKPGERSQAAGA
jgi:5-methylcytosine-specific restriction endonuclease McrA